MANEEWMSEPESGRTQFAAQLARAKFSSLGRKSGGLNWIFGGCGSALT
jgi:hypothetical protein